MIRLTLILFILFQSIAFCKAQTKSFAFTFADYNAYNNFDTQTDPFRYTFKVNDQKTALTITSKNGIVYTVRAVKNAEFQNINLKYNVVWVDYLPTKNQTLFFSITKKTKEGIKSAMLVSIKNADTADFSIIYFKNKSHLKADLNFKKDSVGYILKVEKLNLYEKQFRIVTCYVTRKCEPVWLPKPIAPPPKPVDAPLNPYIIIGDDTMIDPQFQVKEKSRIKKIAFIKIADSIMINHLGKEVFEYYFKQINVNANCKNEDYYPAYFRNDQNPDCDYAYVGYQYYSANNEVSFRMVLTVSIKNNTGRVLIDEGETPAHQLTIYDMAFLNTAQMKTKARAAFPKLDLVLSVNAMDTTKKDVGYIHALPVVKTDWQGKEFEPSLQGLEVSHAGKTWKGGFVFKAYSKVRKNNEFVEIYFFDAVTGVFLYKEIHKTVVFG